MRTARMVGTHHCHLMGARKCGHRTAARQPGRAVGRGQNLAVTLRMVYGVNLRVEGSNGTARELEQEDDRLAGLVMGLFPPEHERVPRICGKTARQRRADAEKLRGGNTLGTIVADRKHGGSGRGKRNRGTLGASHFQSLLLRAGHGKTTKRP